MNDNKVTNITPHLKHYRDFSDMVESYSNDLKNCKNGILVMFDNEGAMLIKPLCTKSQMAFAAADLLKQSATDN